MKKLMAILAAVSMAVSAQAATGWFQDYIVASVDGGADAYYWIGDNPSFGTQFNGADFGPVTTLEFGSDMRYWSDTQDRDGGAWYYSIDGGSATEVVWTQAYLGGNDYQGTGASTVNVANSLAAGSHTVTVWAKSWGNNQGDSWLTNGGLNYSATFTVVPEPATMALFGLGLAGVVAYRRRQS